MGAGPVDTDYRLNLLASEMCAREVRLRMAAHVKACEAFPPALVRDKEFRDEQNAGVLRKYWTERGFPSISRVGHDGAHAAFVIAFYTDHNRTFQTAFLHELEKAAKAGDAHMRDYMMLYDRLRAAHHRKQKFGTALLLKDNCKLVQAPVMCEVDANKWRKRVGWGTMKEWQAEAQAMADAGHWDKSDVWSLERLLPDNGQAVRAWSDADWAALGVGPVAGR